MRRGFASQPVELHREIRPSTTTTASGIPFFLTRDPIRYGDGPNIYCYVHCNPITHFDPLGLSWWNPLSSDFVAYEAGRFALSTLDTSVDITVTAVGGVKDVALSVVSTPFVAAERAVFNYRTIPSYLGKHLSRPFGSGFSGRWNALQSTGLIGSTLLGLQEVPGVGNFVPGQEGNMNGTPIGMYSGGINADSAKIAKNREDQSSTFKTDNTGIQTYSTPYDRGTVTEVILGMFGGYKAPALEWTAQVLSTGADSSNSIYSDGHSGGVIRSSIGSNYLAAYGIGVARQYSEQGPAIGLFRNMGLLRKTYSIGKDVTSDIGFIFSPFYLSSISSCDPNLSNAEHWQTGRTGQSFSSEWNQDSIDFFKK